MRNSAPPRIRYSISSFLINIVDGVDNKKPTTRLRCRPWIILRPKPAAGGFRFYPLHSRVALRSTILRSIPFIVCPSLGYPLKSATIHSITLILTRRFILLPVDFPIPLPETQSQTGSYIPPTPIRYTEFSHLPCFSQPNQRYILRSVHPWNPKTTNAPPPFNGTDKNKGSFVHGHVLAAGSSHSFNRSIRTSFHYFIRSSHQLQHPTCKCFVPHTHTYPHPRQQLFQLFDLRIVCPIKLVPDHCRFIQPSLITSSYYWNENNYSRTSHCQLFPISTAHHHTWNLTFPFL